MWLHINYSHLSDLHLLSSFVILQSVTFQSCNVVRHFPVLQIQVTPPPKLLDRSSQKFYTIGL